MDRTGTVLVQAEDPLYFRQPFPGVRDDPYRLSAGRAGPWDLEMSFGRIEYLRDDIRHSNVHAAPGTADSRTVPAENRHIFCGGQIYKARAAHIGPESEKNRLFELGFGRDLAFFSNRPDDFLYRCFLQLLAPIKNDGTPVKVSDLSEGFRISPVPVGEDEPVCRIGKVFDHVPADIYDCTRHVLPVYGPSADRIESLLFQPLIEGQKIIAFLSCCREWIVTIHGLTESHFKRSIRGSA